VTAADGTYSIDKALLGYNNIPVDHMVTAFVSTNHPRAFYYYTRIRKGHLDVCGAQRVVNLVLPPIPMGHIEGHVYDDNNVLVAGAPSASMPSAAARAWPRRPPRMQMGTTGSRTSGTVTWPSATSTSSRAVLGKPRDERRCQGRPDHVHDIHIVRKKFASVTGTVRNAITGAPIEGAFIVESRALVDPAPSRARQRMGATCLARSG
jgi:hypothetical protein